MDIGPRKNTQVPVVPSRSNAFNPLTGQSIRVGPPDFKRFFVVEQIDGDYLLCVDEKSNLTIVALPFALQESALYNNGQKYVWGEIGILKNSQDVAVGWQQARTVDEVSEVIAPAYMLGEPILAMRLINDTDPSVKWVDVNASGRFWANAVNNTPNGFVKIFRRSLEGTHKRMSWVYAMPGLGDRSRIAVLLEDLPDPYTHDTIPEGIAFREADFRADYALASLGNGFSVDTETIVPAIDPDVYYVPSPDTVGTWITKTREEILALDYFSILDTSSKTTTDVWQLNNIWHYRGGCFAAINFRDINRAGNGIVVDTEGMIRLDANVPTGSVTGQMALIATGNGRSEFVKIADTGGGGAPADEATDDPDIIEVVPDSATLESPNPAGSDYKDYTEFTSTGLNALQLKICSRVSYNELADKKLYGFIRTLSFDRTGRLYSVSDETRFEINTPVEL